MSNVIEGRFLITEVNTLEELVANELYIGSLILIEPMKITFNCLEDQALYFYKTQLGEDGKYRFIRDGTWIYKESEE